MIDLFRDLRTYLIAGSIWMLILWLVIADEVPAPSAATGISAKLYRGAEAAGPTVSTIFALLGTLVVGFLSVQVFRAPSLWFANGAIAITNGCEALVLKLVRRWATSPVVERSSAISSIPVDLARRAVDVELKRRFPGDAGASVKLAERQSLYNAFTEALLRLPFREPESYTLAMKYLEDATLRLSLVVPMIVLAVLLAISMHWAWLLAIAVIFVLAFQAAEIRRISDGELTRLAWNDESVKRVIALVRAAHR